MNRCLPGLADDQYRSLWLKCRQILSLEGEKKDLELELEKSKRVFAVNAIHREFRAPWVIDCPKKKAPIERIFASHQPSDDPAVPVVDEGQIFNFLQDAYRNRISKVCELAINDTIKRNRDLILMNSCETHVADFAATFAIPPLFGHFLGKSNITDFIEAVGGTFDNFASDQETFLTTFDGSFLCLVLREFFFSSVMRPFVGEQFTAFFDLFSLMKKADGVQYTRAQRFLSLFLSELTGSISGCPLLRVLFTRVSREFNDKTQVIMTVIVYSIIGYMMAYPRAYGVVPLTANYSADTHESVHFVKYYSIVCSGLAVPKRYASFTPVQDWETIDSSLIEKLVEELLRPGVIADGPELETVYIPMRALLFLAKFSGVLVQEAELKRLREMEETIVMVPVVRSEKSSLFCPCDSDVKLILELMTSQHLEMDLPMTSRTKAIRVYFSLHPPDIEKVSRVIEESCQSLSERVIGLQASLSGMNRAIQCAKQAVAAADTYFVNAIAYAIYTKYNIANEVEKKKNAMWKDGEMFANFVCNTIDAFAQRNPWAKSFVPMIARRFHSLVMTHFKLSDFCDKEPQLFLDDQKFLSMKPQILQNLEEKGLDPCVEKLVSAKNIFDIAQMAVMRACLFENPIESARQIVHSLFVIDDLFVFEFGVQPEANQLMPLLANLFISTPIPSPLCFGRWMNQFLQPAIRKKPDWFLDQELRPLEHYFQFNAWIEDMLKSM